MQDILTLTATGEGHAAAVAEAALAQILATARWSGPGRAEPAALASWDRPDKVWR